jgi:hypothetical protein
MAEPPAKMGRPVVEFTDKTWEQLEAMAQLHCTGEEMAAIIGVSYDTLVLRVKERHGVTFSEWYKTHSHGGKMSLRRAQFKTAVEKGNPTMQIWLGKQYLGQTDNVDITHHAPRPTVIKRVDGTEVVLGAIESHGNTDDSIDSDDET